MSYDEVLDLGAHRALKNDFATLLVYGYGYDGVSAHSIARHLVKDVRAASRWAAVNPPAPSDAIQAHLESSFTSSLRVFRTPASVTAPANTALLIESLLGCVERASLFALNARAKNS